MERQKFEHISELVRRVRETSPLGKRLSPDETLHQTSVMLEAILEDEPGKTTGIQIRSNVRGRFCEGHNCPIQMALRKLRDRDDLKHIRSRCKGEGLDSAYDYYGSIAGERTPPIPEKFTGQFVFTADCKKHPGDEIYANYTNCGSLMATNLRMLRGANTRMGIALQAIRAKWFLNNASFTNPPLRGQEN